MDCPAASGIAALFALGAGWAMLYSKAMAAYETLPDGTIDEIVQRRKDGPGGLLGILEEVQAATPGLWLPEESLRRIALASGIPPAKVYAMATFYPDLSLEPRGAHSITVCRGTACHTRGSLDLLRGAAKRLGLGRLAETDGRAATDIEGRITVRAVACLGLCALAPVVVVDGVTHSRVSAARIAAILESLAGSGPR